MKILFLCLLLILISGCSRVSKADLEDDPVTEYVPTGMDGNQLSVIRGSVIPGWPLVKLPENLRFCGIDGKRHKAYSHEAIYAEPGEQALCVRVVSLVEGPLLKGLNDKKLSFQTEAGKTYVVMFKPKGMDYAYWVESIDGQTVSIVVEEWPD